MALVVSWTTRFSLVSIRVCEVQLIFCSRFKSVFGVWNYSIIRKTARVIEPRVFVLPYSDVTSDGIFVSSLRYYYGGIARELADQRQNKNQDRADVHLRPRVGSVFLWLRIC